MVVDRVEDVHGVQRLAVVELHVLAEVEAPGPGVRCRLPALGQTVGGLRLVVELDQRIAKLLGGHRLHPADGLCGVQVVARVRIHEPHAQPPALLRSLGAGRFAHERRGQGHSRRGEGRCPGQEFATAEVPLAPHAIEAFDFFHEIPPDTCGGLSWAFPSDDRTSPDPSVAPSVSSDWRRHSTGSPGGWGTAHVARAQALLPALRMPNGKELCSGDRRSRSWMEGMPSENT